MIDSIFTKIIKGEIPCHRVYEDDRVIAFLDIHPIRPGHTLVVPKIQIENIWDLADDDYRYLWDVTKRLAVHIQGILNPKKVGVIVEGLEVPHAHIHLIPIYDIGDLRKAQNQESQPDHPELAEIAKKLAA